MLKPLLAALVVLAFTPAAVCASFDSSDQNNTDRQGSFGKKDSAMSDREKAGLHGRVRQCTEEQVRPAVEGWPEMKFSTTREYDLAGRILSSTSTNSDGSKSVMTYAYDPDGRLLKTNSSFAGQPATETKYSYDAKGRLIGVIGAGSKESVRFEYDDHGRKTRIVTSNEKPLPPGMTDGRAVGFDPENSDLVMPAPEGGTVKTLYDDRDQATEAQVYDSDGQLRSRMFRTYDAQGRPAETRMQVENIELVIPAEIREKILAESGGTAAELKEYLTQMLGGEQGMFGISFKYDGQGRVIEKRQRIGPSQQTVTTMGYNEQGDKIEERSSTTGELNPGEAVQPATAPQTAEIHISYEYDSFGNWTKQTISSQSNPNEQPKVTNVSHRTITYY